jgi:hypothetical protein
MQRCHCNHRHPDREAGFSFAELAFAVLILVIGSVVLINHLTVNYSETKTQKDRVFAFTKAQAILAEIQAFVDRGAITAAIQLDELDDGVTNKPTLTITTDALGNLVAPDHPLSENYQRNGTWVWSRRITVRPFQGLNNRNVRYVTVRIDKKDQNGVDRTVASLSSVVNSVGSGFPTTQVFDVYLLAVENIPGWWVFMEAIVPFVESAITDIESRNPGLKMRTHWITKASYGRDPMYRPYINDAVDSTQPVDQVYFYPGRMPAGNASTYYYVPDLVKARMSFDGVERGGYDANTNPYPYALTDFYNHAMRYPEEKAYWQKRTDAARARRLDIQAKNLAGLPAPPPLYDMDEEPTLRLFLEDLNTNPDKYRNALVINLHGELLPMPSLRNYSDAAKAPGVAGLESVRVVTHPQELRTMRDPVGTAHDDVVLRAYAYSTTPDALPAGVGTTMPAANPIAIQVMNVDLTDKTDPTALMAGAKIECLQGGVDRGDGNTDYFDFLPAKRAVNGPLSNEMWYEVSFDNSVAGQEFTLIKLYRTPIVCPGNTTGGLDTTTAARKKRSRLYNLEYIPSCTEAALDFSRNLATDGEGPKNTARWKITIPKTVFEEARFYDATNPLGPYYDPASDVTLEVRTRIWDPLHGLNTGTMWPTVSEPENLSTTYTWWADSPEDVPITERSQFQGDPRHNPYKDLWQNDPDFSNGYNWFHDSLANNSETSYTDYPGISTSRRFNRWMGLLRQDVPRFFELLRSGLVKSNAVYTTLTGYSYYYMGHGNEIGYDAANGYPTNGIPVNSGPWSTSTAGAWITNNIINWRDYVVNANMWWGMPWLGELYPDNVYDSQWAALDGSGNVRGNLQAAGWGPDRFLRIQDQVVYQWSLQYPAHGTALLTAQQRTSTGGCTSFFNATNGGGTFTHLFSSGSGNLVGAGLDLASNYNYPIPSSAPINRPWQVNGSPTLPPEYTLSPYSTHYTSRIVKTYYNHPTSGQTGSGLVELTDPSNTSAAYIVVNGISNAVASGSSFIAKYSLLTMVQSFLEGGDPSLTHRIKMPPRVEIQSPTEITELNDPGTIDIQFDTFWVRWDGLKYTSSTSPTFAENESEIEYAVMYSKDNGQTWLHTEGNVPAEPGVKPTSAALLYTDGGAGPESVPWDVSDPTAFTEGSYLIRVEAYRQNQSLHYSQHQVKIYIAR